MKLKPESELETLSKKTIILILSDLKGNSLKWNINDITMGPYNFYKHKYL